MAVFGWKYKTGEKVEMGDNVRISKRWQKEHKLATPLGTVVGLHGFVSVQVADGSTIDFDMRSLTFVSRNRRDQENRS